MLLELGRKDRQERCHLRAMLLRVIISFLHVALTATTSAAAQDAQIKGKMMSSRGGSMSRLGGVKTIMVGLCIASLLTWTIVTNAVGPIGTTAQTAVALVGGIVSILAYGIVIWAMQYDAMGVVSARNQRGFTSGIEDRQLVVPARGRHSQSESSRRW